MGVARAEVVATLLDPEKTYPSPPAYGLGRRVSAGGRLAVVHTEDFVVITVMWDKHESRDADPRPAA